MSPFALTSRILEARRASLLFHAAVGVECASRFFIAAE